jgi:hypothetical protein
MPVRILRRRDRAAPKGIAGFSRDRNFVPGSDSEGRNARNRRGRRAPVDVCGEQPAGGSQTARRNPWPLSRSPPPLTAGEPILGTAYVPLRTAAAHAERALVSYRQISPASYTQPGPTRHVDEREMQEAPHAWPEAHTVQSCWAGMHGHPEPPGAMSGRALRLGTPSTGGSVAIRAVCRCQAFVPKLRTTSPRERFESSVCSSGSELTAQKSPRFDDPARSTAPAGAPPGPRPTPAVAAAPRQTRPRSPRSPCDEPRAL